MQANEDEGCDDPVLLQAQELLAKINAEEDLWLILILKQFIIYIPCLLARALHTYINPGTICMNSS